MLNLIKSIFVRSAAEPAGPQYGAIPYTFVDGQLVLLLITSLRPVRCATHPGLGTAMRLF